MGAIVVIMFEATSDTSLTIPMLLASTLSRSVTNLHGVDGWAHILAHAPHVNLPHHSVEPKYWVDQKLIAIEDLVAHPTNIPCNSSHEVDHGVGGGHGKNVQSNVLHMQEESEVHTKF